MADVTVVIAYDVSADHRRARLAALLQMTGDRLQRSVFLCRLDVDDLPQLLDNMTRIIDPTTDAIHLFRQCRTCWDNAHTIGQANVNEPVPFWIAL